MSTLSKCLRGIFLSTLFGILQTTTSFASEFSLNLEKAVENNPAFQLFDDTFQEQSRQLVEENKSWTGEADISIITGPYYQTDEDAYDTMYYFDELSISFTKRMNCSLYAHVKFDPRQAVGEHNTIFGQESVADAFKTDGSLKDAIEFSLRANVAQAFATDPSLVNLPPAVINHLIDLYVAENLDSTVDSYVDERFPNENVFSSRTQRDRLVRTAMLVFNKTNCETGERSRVTAAIGKMGSPTTLSGSQQRIFDSSWGVQVAVQISPNIAIYTRVHRDRVGRIEDVRGDLFGASMAYLIRPDDSRLTDNDDLDSYEVGAYIKNLVVSLGQRDQNSEFVAFKWHPVKQRVILTSPGDYMDFQVNGSIEKVTGPFQDLEGEARQLGLRGTRTFQQGKTSLTGEAYGVDSDALLISSMRAYTLELERDVRFCFGLTKMSVDCAVGVRGQYGWREYEQFPVATEENPMGEPLRIGGEPEVLMLLKFRK